MKTSSALLGIRGWLVDAPEYGRLRSWSDGALLVRDGVIEEVGDYVTLSKKPREVPVRWVSSSRYALFPGLIDLHTHIAQYPGVARAQTELLPWLRQYGFPLEREFNGPKARREARAFFHDLARHGTTTAMVWAALYQDSCDASFHAASEVGLRTIMGQTMLDIGSYGATQPTKIASISLHESERLCEAWHGANDGLIEYALSPRFAASCSEKLMRGAAELAARTGAYIQTHLAENLGECEKVKHQFPWARDYTEIYEKCGLLTARTVLGQCLHLSAREHEAVAQSGAGVAHCPSSNLFLRSGLLPLDRVRAAGIPVGLGSDVAAGPELNLWRVMRSAIETQNVRMFYEPGLKVFSPAEAFFLATSGAAQVLGKSSLVGSFEPGKQADCIVIDYKTLLPYHGSSGSDLSPEDLVSLCIYRGGPAAVLETFVRGRSIYRAPEAELF